MRRVGAGGGEIAGAGRARGRAPGDISAAGRSATVHGDVITGSETARGTTPGEMAGA
jgi:hypothetical protein